MAASERLQKRSQFHNIGFVIVAVSVPFLPFFLGGGYLLQIISLFGLVPRIEAKAANAAGTSTLPHSPGSMGELSMVLDLGFV